MSGAPAPHHITPVLVEGLDPVLLIRLYPEAAGLTDAATQAVAQGEATGAAGEALEGSQYEPIVVEGVVVAATAASAHPPGQTNAQKKQAAIAKAQVAVKAAESGTQAHKAVAAAELKAAHNMPD